MAEKNRSFDILGDDQEPDLVSALLQSHMDIKGDFGTSAAGILLKRTGDRVFLEYHCYETSLDDRGKLEGLCKEVEKVLADYVKALKKDVKKKTKKALKLKEIKELKDYSVDKVSLNDRWYLRLWRVYEVSPSTWDED